MDEPSVPTFDRSVTRPASIFEIKDLETLKVIADPLRARIFEQMVAEPRTVKQVASSLGLTSSRLYYHVTLLEEHGLIRVVKQRLVGNLVEKVYQAVAPELDVAPELLSFEVPTRMERVSMLAVSTLDATRQDLAGSLEARAVALDAGAPQHARPFAVLRDAHRIPESKAREFCDKVKVLFDEFDSYADSEASDAQETHIYAFTVAFYPHFDYPSDVDEERNEEDVTTTREDEQ